LSAIFIQRRAARELWNVSSFPRSNRSAAEIAEAEKVTRSFVNRLLRLTLLAPDIQEAILEARQSKGLQLKDAGDAERVGRTTTSLHLRAIREINTPTIRP
jgi:ribosome-binding protein aMBF1 (putative translation factor)